MNTPEHIAAGVGPLGYVAATSMPEPEERGYRCTEATANQIKAQFRERGESVGQWADANGFRRSDVYRVLNGFSACKRGLQHEIAVKLGLKPDPAKTPA